MTSDNFRHRKDRYLLTMLKASAKLARINIEDQDLVNEPSVFAASQRKAHYTVVLGTYDLWRMMSNDQMDQPHARALRADPTDLSLAVDAIENNPVFPGQVFAFEEGTISFANEPFAVLKGPYGLAQTHELKFQHAFDLNMTTAYWAMEMREAAGDEASLVDFSYRRDGSYERALQIAWAAFICGFNSTSNLDAGDEYGLQTTGTMAHHWLQRFIKYARPENWQIDVRTGKPKHFEQIGFEKWLDAYIDEGTTCLPDAFGLVPGMRHLAMAATSTPARSAALRNIRIDSGKNAQDYAERIIYAWEVLQKTGLVHVGIIPSGDMSARMIREIKAILDQHSPAIKIPAWPIGTKLAAEVEFVVSVIFKLYQIGNEATMKLPDTRVKATLPGDIQVWRCIDLDDEDNPYYVKDIMALWNEPMPRGKDFTRAEPLLKLLWGKGADQCIRRSPQELKAFVQAQKKKFRVPLKQYPVVLSPALAALQKDTIELIDEDPNDYSVIGL